MSVPRTRAVIEGHTDSIGDPSSNRVVSYARAAAVRDYLLDRGIEPRRLKIMAFGAERPVDSNLTPEGRSENNRVVTRISSSRLHNERAGIPGRDDTRAARHHAPLALLTFRWCGRVAFWVLALVGLLQPCSSAWFPSRLRTSPSYQ